MTNETHLAQADERIRDRIRAVLLGLRTEGYTPRIACSWRSVAEQRRLRHIGRSRVDWSFHNHTRAGQPAALAADIFDGNLGYPPTKHPFWQRLGHYARLNGLKWGGDWKNFKDFSHIETAALTLAHAKAESN
jgi:hypothetical protein